MTTTKQVKSGITTSQLKRLAGGAAPVATPSAGLTNSNVGSEDNGNSFLSLAYTQKKVWNNLRFVAF